MTQPSRRQFSITDTIHLLPGQREPVPFLAEVTPESSISSATDISQTASRSSVQLIPGKAQLASRSFPTEHEKKKKKEKKATPKLSQTF